MKNLKLWNVNGNENMVVYQEDIKRVVDLSNSLYFETSLNPETTELKELNVKAEEARPEVDYSGDLESWLKDIGFDANATACRDYEEENNTIVYDKDQNQFFNLLETESFESVEWWNGGDWQLDILFDTSDETEIATEDDGISIDEWDGSNWQTGSIGRHETYYKIVEVDGDTVKDMYLLYCSSQFQGEYSHGEIMTLEELQNHMKELGRDLEKYEF